MGVLIAILLGVVNIGPLRPFTGLKGNEVLSFVCDTNVVVIWVCAGFLILSMFKKLIYRFQVLFSAVMAAMAVGLVYSVCLLALPMATLIQTRAEAFSATLFTVTGLSTVVLVAGATAVHVFLLRRRLRLGHSQSRTLGNIVAVSGSNTSKTFWITLGVVMLVPNVLTLGEYLPNTIGVALLVFFACVTTSLPVEFAYLAYLKSKDRVYWEPHWSSKSRASEGPPRHAANHVEDL